MYVTLIPAYGRDYASARAVKDDWNRGKDFIIACIAHTYDGKPMNKEQAEKGCKYQVRYAKQMKVCNL